eukprot:CAMPEP_0194517466 /NCGR_PEP_ID=MMETSP0253-20130528/50640_1 /TAXON_ID=2966 /ORGANISM="Noctiluca scintillans" /LENGTH=242 /DNA_ID=CAMNT_0039361429 /DNA_START=56 /DNA_END=784 /DNA_ORIENTATION=-
MSDETELVERVTSLQKALRTKKTFVASCRSLAEICERGDELPEPVARVMGEAGKCAFTMLQTRYSDPKFWQEGLALFLNIEFHVPSIGDVAQWRDRAMEEVDEEAREQAQKQKQAKKDEEARRRAGGALDPANFRDLLAMTGIFEDETGRPPMAREARSELSLVTVVEEEVCVICQEMMPVGLKAKVMPCGHKFHDDCLLSWVEKHNSCPSCRYDELPSEKQSYDTERSRVVQAGAPSQMFG